MRHGPRPAPLLLRLLLWLLLPAADGLRVQLPVQRIGLREAEALLLKEGHNLGAIGTAVCVHEHTHCEHGGWHRRSVASFSVGATAGGAV